MMLMKTNRPEIAIFTLTSELHDQQAVGQATHDFLVDIFPSADDYVLKGSDYAEYGAFPLNIIYVRTGGTEGIFSRLLSELQVRSSQPFYLLTSGKSNSLAASMEILSYLRQRGLKGEIIHGSAEYISLRICMLLKVEKAVNCLRGKRLGVIGEPSDWLISSGVDDGCVQQKLEATLVHIPMKELIDAVGEAGQGCLEGINCPDCLKTALPGASRIYHALKSLVGRHALQGFTLRCFDLLTAVHNTGCLALARLNSEGIVAGCEGDVPALMSMAIAASLTGMPGFQSNPSTINPESGELLFAHCTIPFSMLDGYELDTHFESGIGIGVSGRVNPGPVTVFKVSANLSRCFVEEGTLIGCEHKADLCRTQMRIQLQDADRANYFLTNPIGNHHIILKGHHKALLTAFMNRIS